MKIHSTNYLDTFIQIADDCPATIGQIPPKKNDVISVASRQFELVSKNPYKFTSDDVLFLIYAERNDLTKSEFVEARRQFFSKGQPCFRASPLTKRYGWGVHCDKSGRIAIYGCETKEYKSFSQDPSVTVIKAMKSKK